MEYLNRLVMNATQHKEFHFHPKCKKIQLTHLTFADDLMVFSRGDLQLVGILKKVIDEFSSVFGLNVNFTKSSIFFGRVKEDDQQNNLAMLDYAKGQLPVCYLGVPLHSSRLQVTKYALLIQKMCSKIQHCTARSLSYAGRSQLITSVLSSTQNFWSSIFPLPLPVI
ncbi:hypothetical protein L6164_004542 [Bauhinia variegata]|uniref:Uncharacterized protein n=1 Tax=Bauhinia variegata TaxID=167791 RepID=A0ACB9Q503_BAUVA|nr:hypothetical protein L6164_004542 [Bauhinia variegata]